MDSESDGAPTSWDVSDSPFDILRCHRGRVDKGIFHQHFSDGNLVFELLLERGQGWSINLCWKEIESRLGSFPSSLLEGSDSVEFRCIPVAHVSVSWSEFQQLQHWVSGDAETHVSLFIEQNHFPGGTVEQAEGLVLRSFQPRARNLLWCC